MTASRIELTITNSDGDCVIIDFQDGYFGLTIPENKGNQLDFVVKPQELEALRKASDHLSI